MYHIEMSKIYISNKIHLRSCNYRSFFRKKISKLRNIKGDKYMIIINGLLFGFTFEILAPVKR